MLSRRQFNASVLATLGGVMARPLAALPAPAPNYVHVLDFAIAGGGYHGLDQALAANVLTKGSRVELRREADNPYDRNAVAVIGPDGSKLGYIPRAANPDIAAAMDEGHLAMAEVIGTTNDRTDFFATDWDEGEPVLRLLATEYSAASYSAASFV
ncbi:MAG: HIRAN domain-containing protein [Paracoccus sp. (in: a-proteobacteria)]|uniref:HIRAN domain-containing protein n=1 Tax=Paracoccus sp. TaxID=267 RepID=UPI0026E0CB1D|nr:HIRAN domain-containing protein [Paracoccus sp. (in: a-proteobacteria)]MDO5621071.1 HIRAN domain-containing protein [Paracoccus sp. (in: a-proteobacteria)]